MFSNLITAHTSRDERRAPRVNMSARRETTDDLAAEVAKMV
jgi:hypothetical protein